MSQHVPTAELRQLEHENARLKAENDRLMHMAKPKIAKHSVLNTVRTSAVALCVLVAVVLMTVANLLFWAGNTIVKQNRFVAATQPIIKDPTVQSSLALYTTNSLFNNVDVQKITTDALPPRADFLAPQLTGQLKTFTQATLTKALAQPALQNTWNQTLAKQHDRLVTTAANYVGSGEISLQDVYNRLATNLSSTKLSFLAGKQLPANVGEVTLINASWLPVFHKVVTRIDTWRLLVVILLVVTVATAAWLSRHKRRTLYTFSLATAVMMAVTLIALHLVTGRMVGKVDPQYTEGVRHIVQIVSQSLVNQTATILTAALVVSAIVWVSGTSRWAERLKHSIDTLFGGRLHTRIFATENVFTHWVQSNKHLLQWGLVAIFAAVMLLVRLTLKGLIIYILSLAVTVLIIEILSGQSVKTSANVRLKTS